jgi:hypothetical protein
MGGLGCPACSRGRRRDPLLVRRGRHHSHRYNILRASSAVRGCQPGRSALYKLEFPTYDSIDDPLNWLNHCEQFFSGQQTPPTYYTWLAAYHLRGAAQTWHFTLVQDEAQPTWERFKELCHLQFVPPVRGSRLAELGHIQFHSTVQDYTER